MPNNLEYRINALEDAHRALAAQHTALIEIFKITAPFIQIDRPELRPRLTILYDTISDLMQSDGQDSLYQADVRRWLDVLSVCVLADKQHNHPSRDE